MLARIYRRYRGCPFGARLRGKLEQGATLIRRYASPDRERHSIQIEINKKLYLDDAKKSENFSAVKRDIDTLIARISDYVRGKAMRL